MKTIKITRKELQEMIENQLNNNEEYYVKWSSWFDAHDYNINLISSTIKSMGIENVHTENQFGWSNQPEVIVFTPDNESEFMNVNKIKKSLQKALNTEWIIINKKDWKSSDNNLDEIISIDAETAERDPDLVKKISDKIGDKEIVKINENYIRKLIENNEKPKITKDKLFESLKLK